MSIEESNRLIAEFMGAELDGEDWHISGRDMTVNNRGYPRNLKYHTSWSWLMPVVEKIETLKAPGDFIICQVTITSHTCNVNYNNGKVTTHNLPHYNETRHRTETETKIDNVFATVVEFIQWYNTQNTQQ